MFPKLFTLPILNQPLQTYGVLIAIGFVLCTQMISREAKRVGYDPTKFTDLAFYLLLVGIAGSRVLFLIVNWRDYVAHPLDMLFFWRGGLVFYGGFLAALGYTVWWSKRHKVPFFQVADIMIPMVAFNHAWGRLGCLAVGCCFGKLTLSGVGIRFPVDSVVQATQHAQGVVGLNDFPYPVHAAQLYEALGELGLFFLMQWYRGRKRFHGQLLLLWLALYPILRSVVEAFRGDFERGFVAPGLSTSQFISIFIVVLAGVLFLRFKRAPLALLLLLPFSADAAQRITQKATINGPTQMPPSDSTMAWSKGRLRMDNGPQGSMLMDFKADKVTMLDHTKKQFQEMPLPEMIKHLRTALAQLQQSMPPEQRNQLSSVLDPKPLDLQPVDGVTKLGNFAVKKYLIMQDGKAAGEVFYTRDIDVTELAPYAKRLHDALKGMGSGWAEVLARTDLGFPVKTVLTMSAMGQMMTYTTEVTAYDSPELGEEVFKAPANYTRAKP